MTNLRESAGQLLWIGFEADAWNAGLEELLETVRPGGVIFFQRNIQTAEQFGGLVRQCATFLRERSGLTPFLAVDLEGGKVDRFRELIAPLPSVRESVEARKARELGRVAGREVAGFSLNVDFAPVLDLASAESASVLGSRTAGESPEEVVRFAEEFLAGLAESRILGCGKHFPGLGSGCLDSHLAMPRIEKSAEHLWANDLAPYQSLAAQLPMVMVAHAAYPALEADAALPASLSRQIVTGVLKEKIGFEGLVLSDDLEMGGVLEGRTVGEAAVQAIEAGCDMLLVCRRAEYVREALKAIVGRAERDEAFRAVTEQAAGKVVRARRALPEVEESKPNTVGALRAEIQTLTAEIGQHLASGVRKGIGV